MTQYADLSGDSGIAAYEIVENGVWVKYKKGKSYLYGTNRPGLHHVLRMIELATLGQGLCEYISKRINTVPKNYERKR
jgi:hypothetical protein